MPGIRIWHYSYPLKPFTFIIVTGIRGSGMNHQLTPQPPCFYLGFYCRISRDIGLRISGSEEKREKRRLSCVPFGWRGCQSAVLPLPTTTCAKLNFSQNNLWGLAHSLYGFPGTSSLIKPQLQLTTDTILKLFTTQHYKIQREDDNSRFHKTKIWTRQPW